MLVILIGLFLVGSISTLALILGGCCQSNITTNRQNRASVGTNLSPSKTLPYSGKDTANSPRSSSSSKKNQSGLKSPSQKPSATSRKSSDDISDLGTSSSGKDSNNSNPSSPVSTSVFTVDDAYKFLKDPAATSTSSTPLPLPTSPPELRIVVKSKLS